MKTFWKLLAAVLAIAALWWFIVGNIERAFVAAAAGAVAWFLSYRAQLREKLRDIEETDRNADDAET